LEYEWQLGINGIFQVVVKVPEISLHLIRFER